VLIIPQRTFFIVQYLVRKCKPKILFAKKETGNMSPSQLKTGYSCLNR
jgi:hypothetical protein